MRHMVRITALMDNLPSENKALTAEHGLSLLIEKDGLSVLFDFGQGPNTLKNAHRLGREISSPDAVVLSHSHYDHAAGFRDYAETTGRGGLLYTGPGFFEPKYAFDGVRYTDLSAGFDETFVREHGYRRETVTDVKEILPGMFAVADFPRTHAFETIPDRFVKRTGNGFVKDDFSDEICLVLDLGEDLCVLVGCSHPGILNIVTKVHDVFRKPVRAVFGGTHLVEADEDRIRKTADVFRGMGLSVAGFSHCSGSSAEKILTCDGTIRACHLGCGDCIFL